MNKVVMVPDHFYNCPICGKQCEVEEVTGWNSVYRVQGPCQVFSCIMPLASDPLHCYNHIVFRAEPNQIAFQEFEVDLGNKSVLFANDYRIQHSIIKNSRDAVPLELSFIIVPDFPSLSSLKKKIRTSLTFS
jgi:hypothetical protein